MNIDNLTTQDKIDILENIDWERALDYGCGLCWAIKYSAKVIIDKNEALNFEDKVRKLSKINNMYAGFIIDLFTPKNARKFSSKKHILAFWFEINDRGYFERKAYVNWMIEEYKKQL